MKNAFSSLILLSSTLTMMVSGSSNNRHLSPDRRPKIINGSNVHTGSNPDRYPYFASMNDASCGAVLVSPRFVLTAAHCVGSGDTDFRIGLTDVNGDEEEIGVTSGRIHDGYNERGNLKNDIAIFELTRDMDGTYVRLGQDPMSDDGTELTVIGFGDTDPSEDTDDPSRYLLRTNVAYMDPEECQSRVGGISADMLCTRESQTGACYGDSGGPLLLEGDSPDADELVGLVSYGGDDNTVGVYARISNLYPWIVANMCDMNPAGVPEGIDCTEVDLSDGGGNDVSDTTSPPSGESSSSSSMGNVFDDDQNISSNTQIPSSLLSSSSSFSEFADDDQGNARSAPNGGYHLRQHAASSAARCGFPMVYTAIAVIFSWATLA